MREFKNKLYKVYLVEAGIYVKSETNTDEMPVLAKDWAKSVVKSLKAWAKKVGVEVVSAKEKSYIGEPFNKDGVSVSFVCNWLVDPPYHKEVFPNHTVIHFDGGR